MMMGSTLPLAMVLAAGFGLVETTAAQGLRSRDEINPPVEGLSPDGLRKEVQQAAESVMGPFARKDPRFAPEMEILESVEMNGYVRQKIVYRSEPGSKTPAFLCIPHIAEKTPVPAVLCLHPTDMKVGNGVVVGLGGKPGRQYAAELAERGFVTLSPAYPLMADYWPNLNKLGYESGTMKAIRDNSAALDLLASLPFVEAGSGFAAIGHSLGGHNALFTALFEPRIRCVAVSCAFDRFADYYGGDRKNWFYGKGWCQVRYMPRLSDYRDRLEDIPFDFSNILAALAPRKVWINSPLHDSNFGWKSVEASVAQALEQDEALGLKERFTVHHPDTGHDFPKALRKDAYRMITSVLRPLVEGP
ncbi:MAG: alpha/beta hydrolase [Verrucomicrobiota bacterium]